MEALACTEAVATQRGEKFVISSFLLVFVIAFGYYLFRLPLPIMRQRREARKRLSKARTTTSDEARRAVVLVRRAP